MTELTFFNELDQNFTNERETKFVRVILPLSISNLFYYRVPYEWNDKIMVGARVLVQFGVKKIITGIVYNISNQIPFTNQTKYILEILDDEPIVSEQILELWNWISRYYMCYIGEVYNAALPASLKMVSESTICLADLEDIDFLELDKIEQQIIDILLVEGDIKIENLEKSFPKVSIFKFIKSLYFKGLILLKEDIGENYIPRKVKTLTINPNFSEYELRQIFEKLEKKSIKKLNALMQILDYSKKGILLRSFCVKNLKIAESIIKALIDEHIVIQELIERYLINNEIPKEELPPLSTFQNNALKEIEKGFSIQKPVLLHGDTASGKTMIYMHLAKKYIDNGLQVLILIPEIALTTQIIQQMISYFPNEIEITHSKYSKTERFETWQKIKNAKPCIVIGSRSAVFLPFQNLGLIIIDEEHDSSYKQNDPAPRYQAKQICQKLAEYFKSDLLFSSATPSFETYYQTTQNHISLVTLNKKFEAVLSPSFQILNLQHFKRSNLMKGPFTQTLLDEIELSHQNGKQILIFLNKKGYVPVTECDACGWTPTCINCSLSLTYYMSKRYYKCNICSYQVQEIKKCNKCESTRLKTIGYGTEKIEETLQLYLPHLKIVRLDSESAKTKNNLERIISKFENKEYDVIIGTQMISKGFNFRNLELVAIINADQLINFPDFRSTEKAFQQMVQVSGRVGRFYENCKVIIQTHNPDLPIFKNVIDNNYLEIYNSEILHRQQYNYPPFCQLIKIQLKQIEENKVRDNAILLANNLKVNTSISVLGPESPMIAKVRNYYLQQIYIKYDPKTINSSKLKIWILEKIHQIKQIKGNSNLNIICDVNPQ